MSWIGKIKDGFEVLFLTEAFSSKEDLLANIKEKFHSFIQSSGNDQDAISRCEILLDFGVSCLKLFLTENWTGPCLKEEDIPALVRPLFSQEFNKMALADLQKKEEGIRNLCSRLGLFWISYFILTKIPRLASFKLAKVWNLRCLSTYQDILEEKSQSIYEQFIAFLESVRSFALHCSFENAEFDIWDGTPYHVTIPQLDGNLGFVIQKILSTLQKLFADPGHGEVLELDSDKQVEFHLECAHMHLKCYGYTQATEHLEKAREILGINTALTGTPGKRTKFQEKELAQLRLDVTVKDERGRENVEKSDERQKQLPKDVSLDDDTLLPEIKYSESSSIPLLKPLEQAYILSLCNLLEKTRPKDNILVEELHAHIQAVMKNPQSWAVQSKALYTRSLLDAHKSRTVERSMMQMESLVTENRSSTQQADDRLYLLHAVDLPPQWAFETALARILISLGCTKAALEIFERIEAWDDVITCYQKLGRNEKAENIIRSELEKNETSKLWCLLGDVTQDIQYYEKAWEFSKHRNSRSQRSLGYWYLRTAKLQECIPYFQKSLGVSSLQPEVWFSLGCASMAIGQFEIAQNAFQQSVTIEPDNHEAWNNLANVFVRTKQKHKAFKALKEALKANYNSWQVWENYLLVSVDIGEFNDTIRSFHSLLELKRKEIDAEVLRILVRAVTSNIRDASGVPASSLKGKLKELFGRVTSQITNNAEVWLSYGDLYDSGIDKEDKEKALNNYMKANRCFIQNAAWEKDHSKLGLVIEICEKLIRATQNVISSDAQEVRDMQRISSTKMAVANFLKRLEIVYPDGVPEGTDKNVNAELKRLKENYELLSQLLT